MWGTGKPRREFLYSDDLADAAVFLMNLPDAAFEACCRQDPPLLNIGCGEDLTIRELVELVMETVGYRGAVEYDISKPDGTPRKLLDISRMRCARLDAADSAARRAGAASTAHFLKEHAGAMSEHVSVEAPRRTRRRPARSLPRRTASGIGTTWPATATNGERGNRHYHRRLNQIFDNLVPPGQRVLEVGCGQGDLLAALKPSYGVGIDFSREMLAGAPRRSIPNSPSSKPTRTNSTLAETFDVIILSDLINDVWDVETIFARVCALMPRLTRA